MNLIETPSGKTHKQENFPVGSWLISKKLRKQVLIFYHFVSKVAMTKNIEKISKKFILNVFLNFTILFQNPQ